MAAKQHRGFTLVVETFLWYRMYSSRPVGLTLVRRLKLTEP
jgi:hypothetical protein